MRIAFYCARGGHLGTVVTRGDNIVKKKIVTQVFKKHCDPGYNDSPGYGIECPICVSKTPLVGTYINKYLITNLQLLPLLEFLETP